MARCRQKFLRGTLSDCDYVIDLNLRISDDYVDVFSQSVFLFFFSSCRCNGNPQEVSSFPLLLYYLALKMDLHLVLCVKVCCRSGVEEIITATWETVRKDEQIQSKTKVK